MKPRDNDYTLADLFGWGIITLAILGFLGLLTFWILRWLGVVELDNR